MLFILKNKDVNKMTTTMRGGSGYVWVVVQRRELAREEREKNKGLFVCVLPKSKNYPRSFTLDTSKRLNRKFKTTLCTKTISPKSWTTENHVPQIMVSVFVMLYNKFIECGIWFILCKKYSLVAYDNHVMYNIH